MNIKGSANNSTLMIENYVSLLPVQALLTDTDIVLQLYLQLLQIPAHMLPVSVLSLQVEHRKKLHVNVFQ